MSLWTTFRQEVTGLFDFLLPPACPLCGAETRQWAPSRSLLPPLSAFHRTDPLSLLSALLSPLSDGKRHRPPLRALLTARAGLRLGGGRRHFRRHSAGGGSPLQISGVHRPRPPSRPPALRRHRCRASRVSPRPADSGAAVPPSAAPAYLQPGSAAGTPVGKTVANPCRPPPAAAPAADRAAAGARSRGAAA